MENRAARQLCRRSPPPRPARCRRQGRIPTMLPRLIPVLFLCALFGAPPPAVVFDPQAHAAEVHLAGSVARAKVHDAGLPGALARKGVITVAVNNAPPYRIVRTGRKTAASGIYVDIARALAQSHGLELRFVEVPFARALAMIEAGTADLMLGPNRTPERERYMAFLPTPIDEEPKIFITRADRPPVRAYEDLQGRTIGVLDTSVYFERFDADLSLAKFPVSSYELALGMLAAKRIDTVIAPERLGRYLMRRHRGLAVSPYTARGRPSYIAVSRHSPLMASLAPLNATLADMISQGTLDEVIAGYR